ncbi:MAG TPA: hypothetical protein VD905_01905 [Flavobacteriales bacterium]|nr:hypothetical protein [Flavobacteriales bacterium]
MLGKEYRVKALNVSGPGKRIYQLGDIVYENNFAEGVAEELAKQGFLEPINKQPIAEEQPAEVKKGSKKK